MQPDVKLSDATIAVTGATGFLGGYLVSKLRARGARVLAVVRDRDKARRLLPRDVEIRLADLGRPEQLERAFVGADAVVSNAAIISFRAPRATLRTNVEGTRNVFEAMERAAVRRAILISSSAAYPFARTPLDERTPLRPLRRAWFGNAYGVSKAEGERVASAICERSNIALTTVRPCGITGPHDPLLIANIERAMRWRVALLPTLLAFGVVHAEDVAEAVAAAIERPDVSAGKAYNLQGETVSLWQVAEAWRAAGGGSARVWLPVPLPFGLRYDDSLARRELGFRPRGLRAIVDEAVRARRSAAPLAPDVASTAP